MTFSKEQNEQIKNYVDAVIRYSNGEDINADASIDFEKVFGKKNANIGKELLDALIAMKLEA